MKKICVIGSLNMDLVVNVDEMPKKGQTLIGNSFKEVPGGKGANQAVAIARLGAEINMIGKVGNDSFGQTLINQLKTDNVNTDHIHIENCSSGVAMITVDKNAENSIVVAPGANFKVLEEDIDKCIDGIKESEIVVLQLETPININVDEMPKKGQTLIGNSFKEVPGGKGANQAVAIARLGAEINMIGKVGNDSFGQTLINQLKTDNVNTDHIHIENCSSGVAMITVDKNAENSIVVAPGANFKVLEEDIDKCIDGIKESEIVVLQLETPINTIKYALEKSKEFNKFTILNPAPAVKLEDDIIKNVDLLTPNETELEILSGVKINCEEDIKKAAQVMIQKGVKQLIVTLGSKGSLYIDKDNMKFKKSYKVKAIDTTAAGDSYTGALAVALSQDKDIEEAMDFASKVGALSVMKEGAQSSLPTLKDVENFRG